MHFKTLDYPFMAPILDGILEIHDRDYVTASAWANDMADAERYSLIAKISNRPVQNIAKSLLYRMVFQEQVSQNSAYPATKNSRLRMTYWKS